MLIRTTDHNNPPPRPEPKHTRGVRPFSKDRLMMVPRDEAAKCGMALLDKVQQETPEIAMAGTVILFAMWCRRLGLDPFEMHQLGVRMLEPQDFHQKGNIHIEVLRDFAGIRMAGDGRVEAR
jgi:hypothetical protein